MRRIVRGLLMQTGHVAGTIDEAEDGVQALKRIEAGGIEYVVTDWNMPNMPGIDLLRHIRASDDPATRSQIKKVLQALHAPYVMAKTGKEAWDKLQTLAHDAKAEGKTVGQRVAAVLTDLEMPEMDGFTLTRKIKEDERFKRIPVVIHSSLTGAANEDHARNVGAEGYVAKFVAEELGAALRKAIASAAQLGS
ncbi:MAG: response regulator [Betaproteobacteria bacterium]|nr:response regulator [Betaproteobacteria bacterium]